MGPAATDNPGSAQRLKSAPPACATTRTELTVNLFDERLVVMRMTVEEYRQALGRLTPEKFKTFRERFGLPIKVINQPVPKWIAAVKPEGLTVGIQSVASLSIPSWNQILGWLRQMDLLRKASGQAA